MRGGHHLLLFSILTFAFLFCATDSFLGAQGRTAASFGFQQLDSAVIVLLLAH